MKLSETAYQKFLDALHDRRIKLGGNYTQSEICNILGVSTTPLQHALRVLENEGFVEIRARSGITVQRPDLNMFRECHQLRQILELTALPYYVETTSNDDIEALMERIHRHVGQQSGDENQNDIAAEQKAIETQLHLGIISCLRNKTIEKVYITNAVRPNLIRESPVRLTATHRKKTAEEHLEILKAARNRDIEAATSALRQHLLLSLERAVMTNLYTDIE